MTVLRAPLTWLRRRDPGLTSVRRAARVTVVACLGFYVCRYGLGNRVMAPYALFGAVALGMLAQIPGSPAQRARTLFAVLPVGYVLVTAGTLLSVTNWTAAAGMFVFGFLVSYVGVGGPRLVGLATGLQLLYILPCFPPYDPGSLGYRLAGVTIAVLLLAAAERLLWPQPARRCRVGAGRLPDRAGRHLLRRPARADLLAATLPEATDAMEAIRPSRLPPGLRPASAGRRDRALSHASGSARLVLGRAADLYFDDQTDPLNLPAVAALLRQAAASAEQSAAWLAHRPQRGPGPGRGTGCFYDHGTSGQS